MEFAKILGMGLIGLVSGLCFQYWYGQPVFAWRPIVTSNVIIAPPASLAAGDDDQARERASSSDPNAPIVPTTWLPERGRECIRRGKYRGVCQGPRRVPRPEGHDAGIASELGLGDIRAVGHLIFRPPKHDWVTAAGDASRETPLWPVEHGHLSRGLLPEREGHRRHRGLDIAAPEGSLIRATKSGLVAYSDNRVPGYGNLLVVVHPDGSVAFYGHCRAIYVFAGQRVRRGQIVGEVGQTGRATGPHVHFEYRTAGHVRNSLPLFREARKQRRGQA